MAEYTDDSNIIFLDFDGVLTSTDEGNSYLNMDDLKYRPSRRLVKMLKDLCDRTNSKIVIASNWRRYDEDAYFTYGGIRFFNQLPKLRKSLKKYIIGDLPYTFGVRGKRKADYLLDWFNEHKDFHGNFVIFDDADYEKYGETRKKKISSHFVMTNPATGLSESDIRTAESILMRPLKTV